MTLALVELEGLHNFNICLWPSTTPLPSNRCKLAVYSSATSITMASAVWFKPLARECSPNQAPQPPSERFRLNFGHQAAALEYISEAYVMIKCNAAAIKTPACIDPMAMRTVLHEKNAGGVLFAPKPYCSWVPTWSEVAR